MPLVTHMEEGEVVIYGRTRDARGMPSPARVVFTPVPEDLGITYTPEKNRSLILDSNESGEWSLSFLNPSTRYFIVSIDGAMFELRIPSESGRYEFSTLTLE